MGGVNAVKTNSDDSPVPSAKADENVVRRTLLAFWLFVFIIVRSFWTTCIQQPAPDLAQSDEHQLLLIDSFELMVHFRLWGSSAVMTDRCSSLRREHNIKPDN